MKTPIEACATTENIMYLGVRGGVKAWMIFKKDPLIVGTMATWVTSNITFDIDIDCPEY